jgi:multiple sugar transport system permease protein
MDGVNKVDINSSITLKQRIKNDFAFKFAEMKKHKVHYLFMLPYALVFLTFVILPVLIAIFLSFTSFNILEMPRYIGLTNYFNLFLNDDIFMIALKNTFVIAIIIGPVGYLIALLLAWMINDLKRVFRVLFTIFFYAPSLSGGMVIIWNYVFSGDAQGFINGILLHNGLIQRPIQFFQDPAYILPILIIIMLWMSLGTTFLSFIAGFQGIDKQYYEAGAIDGIKNRWQELWFITLPLMRPQLMFGAVISITASFGVGDLITSIIGFPSVNYAAHTVMNHLYDYGSIRYEMGYASAIATILFVMIIVINKMVQKLIRKVGE